MAVEGLVKAFDCVEGLLYQGLQRQKLPLVHFQGHAFPNVRCDSDVQPSKEGYSRYWLESWLSESALATRQMQFIAWVTLLEPPSRAIPISMKRSVMHNPAQPFCGLLYVALATLLRTFLAIKCRVLETSGQQPRTNVCGGCYS